MRRILWGKGSLKNYILRMVFLILAVFFFILLVSDIIAYNEVRAQVTKSNSNTVKIYMRQIDDRLTNINKNLWNICLNNKEVAIVEADMEPQKAALARYALSTTITEVSSLVGDVDSVFYYLPEKGFYTSTNTRGLSHVEKNSVDNILWIALSTGIRCRRRTGQYGRLTVIFI